MTVLVDDDGPELVGASQHFGGELREFEKTDHRGTHPWIYPAWGAHSNYLRNTAAMDVGGIPLQRQHVFRSSVDTALFGVGPEGELGRNLYRDHTGTATVLAVGDGTRDTGSSPGEPNATRPYQVAVLTGEETWAAFAGRVGPDDAVGLIAQRRSRWPDPGGWIERRLPTDEAQLGVAVDARAVERTGPRRVGVNATVENTGSTPHRFVVTVSATPSWNRTTRQVGTATATVNFRRDSVSASLRQCTRLRSRPFDGEVYKRSGGTF